MAQIGERFRAARQRVGLSGRELARRVSERGTGLTQQSYHAIESGRIRNPRQADIIADVINDAAREQGLAFFVTPAYLVYGEAGGGDTVQLDTVMHVEPPKKDVPLVALEVIGRLAMQDALTEDALRRHAKRTLRGDGEGTLAYFEVVGSTMERGAWPTFPSGSLALLEIGAEAESGDFVVALVDGGPVFRRLVREGAQFHLEALNPQYPPISIDGPINVIGVVREVRMQI